MVVLKPQLLYKSSHSYYEICVLFHSYLMEAQMVRIDRTSSIESEPRTLRIQQIQSARDLAIYVLSTNTIEEASRIFTEGLEPVVSGACSMGSGEEILDMEFLKDTAALVPAFRDIASAPF